MRDDKMNKLSMFLVLVISLMGCVSALDGSSVEMRPGEAAAEMLFNYGIGQPWAGGNPPSSDVAISQYSQYYSMTSGSVPNTHIIAPQQYQISGNIPATVYFNYKQQAVPYTQYQSYATYTGDISLWIQGTSSWTQYASVPQGAHLSLIATASNGGNGYLYEIYPDGRFLKNNYYYFPGYNRIGFIADTIGQHILLFVIDGKVSNAIVLDVVKYQQYYPYPNTIPSIQTYSPGTFWQYGSTPVSTTGYFAFKQPDTTSKIETTPSTKTTKKTATTQETEKSPMKPILTEGDTPVHLISESIKGYQLFVDGDYIGTDGAGLDRLDGKIYFWLDGDQKHEIRVYNVSGDYKKTIFFQKEVLKTINVESGRGIYT
jgi:hypothetical protein